MATMPTAEVLAAVTAYVEMLNAGEHPEGYSFVAEPSGSKYRIVMVDRGNHRSVHSFVDGTTGDLFKAAGWKVAAKGARYNLLTEMAIVTENFNRAGGWAGGYLYAGRRVG
jgi:hypothetical protein